MTAHQPRSIRDADPSMTEILASIRRIIADDTADAARMTAREPAPVTTPRDDVDGVTSGFDPLPVENDAPDPAASTAARRTAAGQGSKRGVDEPPEPGPEVRKREPAPWASPRAVTSSVDDRLLSDAANSAVSAAFGSLSHTVLGANARTLDELVQDMLRPMFKSWLDENLPGMVERLVRAEIERVSRRR